MFTGLIQDVGVILDLRRGEPLRLSVETSLPVSELSLGESIAINGVCLTVVSSSGKQFSVEATGETLARTTLSGLVSGAKVNLERAVALGDRLGGHLVLGHVDAPGHVRGVRPQGGGRWLEVEAPPSIVPFLLEKGSIALDGVSLTVSALHDDGFEVALIPETLERTNLGKIASGDRVNIEVDILAKHVERLLEARA